MDGSSPDGLVPTPRSPRAIMYCATCDLTRTETVNDLLGGTKYICPEATFWNPHVACVAVKGTEMKGWLRFQVHLQTCVNFPYRKIPWRGLAARWRVGIVRLASIAVLVTVLFFLARTMPVVADGIAAALILYTLATNTTTVFVSRRPRDAFRASVLALGSFGELVLGFAVIYLSLPAAELTSAVGTPMRAIYFSTVTFATVGFGDIRPAEAALAAPLIVTGQIFIGLYFLTVILTNVVSFASGAPRPLTVKEVLVESNRLDGYSPAA